MTAHDRQGLRAMVREVIREALAEGPRAPGAAEPVRIADDADLAAFVRRLASLMGDPATAARVASGAHRFILAAGPSPGVGRPADSEPRGGLVNEKVVAALPDGTTLRLSPTAVVTPLARDRARARRITLQRMR
jgi:hypothetical protein